MLQKTPFGSIMALLGLVLSNAALASENRLYANHLFQNYRWDGVLSVQSDERGILYQDLNTIEFNDKLRLFIDFENARGRDFGDSSYQETSIDRLRLTLEQEDLRDNQWSMTFRSIEAYQDINFLGPTVKALLRKHSTFSIEKGWRRELMAGLDLELFLGFSFCRATHLPGQKFVPIGGVRLVQNFGDAQIVAELSQGVEGEGTDSGIYGSQIERHLGVQGRYKLSPMVTFEADCRMGIRNGNFEEKGLVRDAPLLLAMGHISLNLIPSLRGRVGYGYRKLIGSQNRNHGSEGSLVMASLQYEFR